MDKVSAVLLSGITVLAIVIAAMMFDTYASGDGLVCNDDTSITNHSDRRLWLRVRVSSVDGEEPGEHRIISASIEAGSWLPDDEGWYYYSMPLDFAQTTEPFADAFYPAGNAAENLERDEADGHFRLDVEAVDEAWLPAAPGSGMEAFELFKRAAEPPAILYL